MANRKAVISGDTTGQTTEEFDFLAMGSLSVTDPDTGQSFMREVTGASAKYGTWSINANGDWGYELDNTNAAVQGLGAGDVLNDTFKVTSLDGSATKTITITINGTNDLPEIVGQTTGSITEDAAGRATGTLTFVDPDRGESGTVAASNVTAVYGSWSVDGSGHWSYKLDNTNPDIQALGVGDTLTDSFTLVSKDGTTSETVVITIKGRNDVPVISGESTGVVIEDDALTASGTLVVTDADSGESHTQPASGTAKYGSWSIDSDGQWNYQLNSGNAQVQALGDGKTLTDTFIVFSEDGSAQKSVKITITGSNDVPVITGGTTGSVKEGAVMKISGDIDVVDIDAGQSAAKVASNVAATYGQWSVKANGQWTYNLDGNSAAVQRLPIGQTLTDTFEIQSADGSASKTVTITILGSNHVATITGNVSGQVSEESSLGTGGTVTVADADAGESHTQVVANGAANYGTFSVDANGHWSYALDNDNADVQALSAGQSMSDTFTVISQDGTASRTVTISISGANDAPVAQDSDVSSTEDFVIDGQLAATDIDRADVLVYSLKADGAPLHGSIVINADGSYTYTPNAEYSGTDSFTYEVVDQHGGYSSATVNIVIAAVNDAPANFSDSDPADNVVSFDAVAGTAVGLTVHASDAEGDTVSYALTNNAGGRFQIDAQTGEVTVAAGANLAVGTYVVSAVATDGVKQSVQHSYEITVTGPNHAPVLNANAIGVAFTAATSTGWALWVGAEGGQPTPVANFGTSPQFTLQVGNKLYFTGGDGAHGNELWSYDLSTGVSNIAADIWSGKDSANPAYLTELGGKFYFSAYDAAHGNELWVYDPVTQAATLASDVMPGSGASSPQYLTAVGGKLYFEAYDGTRGGELWVYDPATQATTLAADVWPGSSGSYPKFLTEVDGKLYFNAYDSTNGGELWIYDPATHNTSVINIIPGGSGSYPSNFVEMGGKLYFSAMDSTFNSKLFIYDPVTQTASVAAGSPSSFYGPMTDLNGKLYFAAYANGNYQLFAYDPVTHSTQIVNDAPFAFSPSFMKAVGGQLYFSGEDGESGRELWVFNPTTGHAELYADLVTGSHVQVNNQGISLGGKIYFHGYDEANGSELWAYDPATNTAAIAADIWPGPNGTYPFSQAALNGKLYFAGAGPTTGNELWVYDPATETASIAADILLGGSSNPQFLTAVAGKLYFSADDGVNGSELWVFDPATGSAALAAELTAGGMGSSLRELTAFNGKLYFNGDDGIHGGQLWVYDPATHDATMLTNMGRTFWPMGSQPNDLTVLGGKLYFNADDAVNGRELWVYDPVTGTTSMAADILAGMFDGNPVNMVALNGKLYFQAFDMSIGAELWSYDPVSGVASLVQDIATGATSSGPNEMTVLGGKLYFTASDPEHGAELRVYDPATNTVSLIADLYLGTGNSIPRQLVVNGDKLFFVASDPTNTDRLWVYDPATHTTTMADVIGGTPNSSQPQQITEVVSNGMALAAITADPTSNLGSTVSAILGLHVTDADSNKHLGIAVTGADTSNGNWEYSLDSGAHWLALGAVSDQSAMLLSETARIRFVPDGGWSGVAEITVRAWDQTDGHHSGDVGVDVSVNGGETAYSTTAAQAEVEVVALHAINGSSAGETLHGTVAADVIDAGQGDDSLIGGGGGDRLLGGAGADQFVYAQASHSTLSHLDVIGDFNAADGDSIDLTALGLGGGVTDGGLVGGFGTGPASGFGGNGLIIETDGANTRIYADSDHSGSFNADTDLVVQMTGNHLNELLTQPNAIVV